MEIIQPVPAEISYAITLIIGIALSIAAAKLLEKKVKVDDKPTTLSDRGDFLPYVLGIRKISCIFAWSGERHTRRLQTKGRSTFGIKGATRETVYFESGWHLLCVGPAYSLRNIRQNGIIIFEGPINRTSHPSGTMVVLGGLEGNFTIYWGELDQPVNSYLGAPSEWNDPGKQRVGVTSRWPGVCYVLWQEKKLGTSPIWPTLEYEIEVRGPTTILTQTTAYMPAEVVLYDEAALPGIYPYPVIEQVLPPEWSPAGVVTEIRILLQGDNENGAWWRCMIQAGERFRLVGNSSFADRDFTALAVGWTYLSNPHNLLFSIFVAGNFGSVIDGYLVAYDYLVPVSYDGMNPAHIIAAILFNDWPYGCGLDPLEWDMASLEALGHLCVTEQLRGSILAINGEEARSVLAGLLLDLGCMVTQSRTTGRLQFIPVREPVGVLPIISRDIQVGKDPEINTMHGERTVDKASISFSDRTLNYRDMTMSMGDDGQSSYLRTQRSRQIPIRSTVDPRTAAIIAMRRIQEEEGAAVTQSVESNRSTRTLLPGQAVIVEGIDEILRLHEVSTDPLSGIVGLELMTDFYGAKISDFLIDQGFKGHRPQPLSADMAVSILEVPEYLLEGSPQSLLIPRIRGHVDMEYTNLLLSRDGSTYTPVGSDESFMTGGTLLEALPATHRYVLAQGPTFTALGPDIGDVLDLSADPVSWRGGRQMAYINGEIFFVQKVTAMGGSVYRLDGLIRARYDTVRQDHAIGDSVFVFQNDDGSLIDDVLLAPQVDIWVKSVPVGRRGSIDPASVVPQTQELYGKGVRPIPIAGLRIGSGISSWTADGFDIDIRWHYFTPRTLGSGAGFQGAGTATSDAPPEGDFEVSVLTEGDVVVRTWSQSTAGYSYPAAQRDIDFGGPVTAFKIRVTQLRGGFSSDPVTRLFTRT